jgi:hypothetical protein
MPQVPTQLAFLFYHVNWKTLFRQGQCSCHPSCPASNHQSSALDWQLQGVLRLSRCGASNSHMHKLFRFTGGFLIILRVHPGALVADVGHFEQIWIQAGGADAVLEERLVSERGAAGDHHPVKIMFFDLLGDMPDAILGAGVQVAFTVLPWEARMRIASSWHIHEAANIQTARAYKDAYPGIVTG